MDLSLISNYQAHARQTDFERTQLRGADLAAELSSGSRVRATDSASLSLASALQAEQASNEAAAVNVDDSTGLLQTADGGLSNMSQILQQMQTLATSAANGGLSDSDRGFLDQTYQSLGAQLQSLAQNTQFNGQILLNGSMGPVTLQVGTSSGAGSQQTLTLPTVTPASLGLGSTSLATMSGARDALGALGTAASTLGVAQAGIGAAESALQYDRDNLGVEAINAAAALSRSGDTDLAATTAERAQNQILQQFQTALAAQANVTPRNLMALLDGPYGH